MNEVKENMAPSPVQPLNGQGVLRISRLEMDGLPDDDLSQEIRIRNRKTPLTFATWNVRSLHRDGALEDLVAETTRYNIDVTAIQEMRWKNTGSRTVREGTFYWSGKGTHEEGTGFFIKKQYASAVLEFEPISSQIC